MAFTTSWAMPESLALDPIVEAAKNLYTILRKIKKSKFKSIVVGKIPNKGLGITINDRLLRASRF